VVQQNLKGECDINNIVAKHKATGIITHVKSQPPQYIDCPSVSYQEACNLVLQAEESFASLPAKLRDRFKNDPASFLSFMDDPANEAEARELGILPPQKPPVKHDEGRALDEPQEGSKDE
jgi:phage internal scaffolding protein